MPSAQSRLLQCSLCSGESQGHAQAQASEGTQFKSQLHLLQPVWPETCFLSSPKTGEVTQLCNSAILKIKQENIGKNIVIEHTVCVQQIPVITNIIILWLLIIGVTLPLHQKPSSLTRGVEIHAPFTSSYPLGMSSNSNFWVWWQVWEEVSDNQRDKN